MVGQEVRRIRRLMLCWVTTAGFDCDKDLSGAYQEPEDYIQVGRRREGGAGSMPCFVSS